MEDKTSSQTKQRLLLKIQTIRVKRKHWTTLQPINLYEYQQEQAVIKETEGVKTQDFVQQPVIESS